MRAGDVRQACQALGLSWRTTQRASLSVGVVRRKQGMCGGWWWALPGHADEGAKDNVVDDKANTSGAPSPLPATITTCLAAYGYEVPDDGLMHGVPQYD